MGVQSMLPKLGGISGRSLLCRWNGVGGGQEERKEWVRVLLNPIGRTGPPGPTHLPAWASSSRARRRLLAFLRLSRCFSLVVICK